MEDQGSCSCAAWTSWVELDVCGDCDSLNRNCNRNLERLCQPAEHFRGEDSGKWSPDTPTSCTGTGIKKEPCSGIYGKWLSWQPCDKTCVDKGEVSTRTRERNCNDTLTGIIIIL